jgi:hypothetical protein
MTSKLDEIYAQTPEYIKLMVLKSLDISERIFDMLDASATASDEPCDDGSKYERCEPACNALTNFNTKVTLIVPYSNKL